MDDFTGLGLDTTNVGVLSRLYGTLSTDDGFFRYINFLPTLSFGEAIGSNNDSGFIDVVLNTPYARVGGWLGASDASVAFYDSNDVLLGIVATIHDDEPVFAGCEHAGGISRVRFADVEPQNFRIIVLDRFTFETAVVVPEPTALALAGIALAALGFRRRKARR